MKNRARTDGQSPTAYEAEQIRRIAAWKSEPPNPLSELWKMLTLPGARALEKVIPDRIVRVAIERADDTAEILAGQEDIKRRAGVRDLSELRERPLEECDRMAMQVGVGARMLATVEGAATGAGGAWTTLFDIPLLFTLALRTIRKIGHCYGDPLDGPRGRALVLGILLTALSGSLEIRRRRLEQLREIEDLLIEEAQEEVVLEEALSFLFQLEEFGEIPGVGAVSGALLNLTLMSRLDVASRRIFQERRLRQAGKVAGDRIPPAEAHPRALAGGVAGVLGRIAYGGCYYAGFGAALPAHAAAALGRPVNRALGRSRPNGAATGGVGVDGTVGEGRNTPDPSARRRRRTKVLTTA